MKAMLSFIKKIQEREKRRQEESCQTAPGRTPEGQEMSTKPEVSRKILVVGQGETLEAEVMDYGINLAERLGYDLVALNLNPTLGQRGRFYSPYRRHLREKFTQRALTAGEALKRKLVEACSRRL